MLEIRQSTAAELLEDLIESEVRPPFIHADPPWQYGSAAPPKHGRVGQRKLHDKFPEHYSGMTMGAIVQDLRLAWSAAADDAYLAVWCTFPTIWDFAREWWCDEFNERALLDDERPPRWQHVTGGSWGKVGRRGIGFHMRGDSEPLLVFRRGRPKRGEQCSNKWETDAPYWPEKKTPMHSEKPAATLADLVKLATKPGDLVVDLYAGASASLARVCHLLERRYIGAECDPERCAKAQGLLATITEP